MTIPVSPWAIVSWISRGHALPLVEHAGLAGLGQQLGMEAGVLLERRLEPGHRHAPLLALLGQLLADEHAGPDRERLDDDDRHVDRPPLGGVGNPPNTVLTMTDVAKMPAISTGHGRRTVAWKNPVIRKMKNR